MTMQPLSPSSFPSTTSSPRLLCDPPLPADSGDREHTRRRQHEEVGVLDATSIPKETVCPLLQIPSEHESHFGYLLETPVYFFDTLRKLNRARGKDRRICFLTDYTINMATAHGGHVSRCAKAEDVEEIVCDEESLMIGIRMRDRPYAVQPGDYQHWNCFYDMPVDLLLFANTSEQLRGLITALCFVYRLCTQKELPRRELRDGERWEETLVLWPDGCRVKMRALRYHSLSPGSSSDSADGAANAHLDTHQAHVVAVPQTRGTRAGSASAASHSANNLYYTPNQPFSPPARPPQRRSAAIIALPIDVTAPARAVAITSESITKRRRNPLSESPPGNVLGVPEYTPPHNSSQSTPPSAAAITPFMLPEVMREQQRQMDDLRRTHYATECELNDLKRHLGRRHSHGTSTCNACASPHSSFLHSRRSLRTGSSSSPVMVQHADSSTSSRQSLSRLPARYVRPTDSNDSVVASPFSKDTSGALESALRRHRCFEKTVWEYYKELPSGLREELRTFQHEDAATAPQPRATERELRYLQQQMRQRAMAPRAESVSNTDSLVMIGSQIDAFAEELCRKQAEIDALRRKMGGPSKVWH